MWRTPILVTAGYSDDNNRDPLKSDPVFKMAVGRVRRRSREADPKPLQQQGMAVGDAAAFRTAFSVTKSPSK
jgi:hypothetical protein